MWPLTGPARRRFPIPAGRVRHRGDGDRVERQRGDQRADGPLPAVIGGKMGEAAEGAPARLPPPGHHRPSRPGAMATSTPSWQKVSASRIGTHRSSTAGAPCSPCTQEHDLSRRTSLDIPPSWGPLPGCRPHGPTIPARHSRARILEGEWGPRLQVSRHLLIQDGGKGSLPRANLSARRVHLPLPHRGENIHEKHINTA